MSLLGNIPVKLKSLSVSPEIPLAEGQSVGLTSSPLRSMEPSTKHMWLNNKVVWGPCGSLGWL